MSIHWDSLLAVFVVSLGSAVAVVVLVALAMLGLSARAAVRRRAPDVAPPRRSRVAGTAVAGPAWRWPPRSSCSGSGS